MATIKPFKGIRPKPEYAKDVAALPYDVMSSNEAREMTAGNPLSFLHVDKSEIDLDPSIDIYDQQVYEKARDNLNKMVANGYLAQDAKPMLYIYRLIMDGREQTGLVVCTSIDEYINGIIKKHELTREDKEQDRIRHVDLCNANTGPIFLAYRARTDINALLDNWTSNHKPETNFVADDGITHQVWPIDDSAVITQLQKAFEAVPNLYIADGHHRNASAVKVGQMRRQANPGYSADARFNFYLSVVFPDDQLYIMDYNRVVKDLNGLTEEQFITKLKQSFLVEPAQNGHPAKKRSFGMYLSGKWYMLTVKPELVPEDPVEALDVSILQNQLLGPVLGIDDPRTSKRIGFVGGMRGLKELESKVNSKKVQVAFALCPTSMDELLSVADADKIMPPKSTWFEPKLRSGLFIHSLE